MTVFNAEEVKKCLEDVVGEDKEYALWLLEWAINKRSFDLEEYRKIYDKLSANHSEMFPPRVLKINVYAELSEYEGTLKFKINDEDDIYEIDMNEKHFISSKEMFNYIYNQVCTITGKDLSDLNSVQFINNLSWKVNFK